MFCRKCGEEISDNAKYCKKCGEIVTEKSTETLGEICEKKEETRAQIPKEPTKKNEKARRNKKIVLGLILLIVVWCILATQFHIGLWVPKQKSPSKKGTVQQLSEKGTVYSLEEDAVKLDEETGIHYVNNIIIVFFTEGTSEDEMKKAAEYVDGEIVGRIPIVNQCQIKVDASDLEQLNQKCAELEKRKEIEAAMIDLAIQLSANVIPDDPWKKKLFLFGEKWDEENPKGSNWWQEAINAPSAWEYKDFLESISIGIVDDGFDLGHDDLRSEITMASEQNSSEEHGTHVAGIVAAEPNNAIGITGVVWNNELYTWDWELTEEQMNSGAYTEWNTVTFVLHGITELIENGAKVINLSAGVSNSLEGTSYSQYAMFEQGSMASEYLGKLLEQGYDFVIVQSAGNGNKEYVSVDATYNGLFCSINEENCYVSESVKASDIINRIIVVGAAENEGSHQYRQADFSNAGSRVDICAPGVDIFSTVPGGYASLDGTSMAAPIVTGVASMVWSANPNLTGEEVKEIVCCNENTKYIVADNISDKHPMTDTYRLVNAELAVKAAIESANYMHKELEKNPMATKEEEELDAKVFSGIIINPEDVVIKMFTSLQKGDYEKAAECLDPELEEKIDFWGDLLASVVSLFTEEQLSWGQLLLEAAGATDVQIIECNSYNLVYNTNMGIIAEILSQIPGVENLICTEADVFVKYRYKYEDTYYISKETYHVKRYEWSGWRVEMEY